tara:strand:- start:17022 stop:18620 length:1599 start_codon:yes stop_codon:yes gene_type:complete
MTLLSSKKQVVSVLEDVAGTTPSNAMITGTNADVLLNAAEPTFDIDYIDREFLRTTITKLKSIPGQKTGGLSLTFEMLGNSDDTFASGPPAWSKFMEMAGFRLAVVQKALIGADQVTGNLGTPWAADGTSGPLRHGEIITDNAGATARLVGNYHPGERFIWFEAISGAMDVAQEPWSTSETEFDLIGVTAFTSQAGWAWIPVSEPLKQVTTTASVATVAGEVYVGDGGTGTAGSGAVIVVGESQTGSTTIIYRPGSTAPVNNEVFTLATAGGTGDSPITLAADAAETFVQWPTGSTRLNEDGVAVDFVGSRANVSFSFEVNRPVVMTVTTRGIWASDETAGSDLDGAGDTPLLAGSEEVIDPKLWAGYGIAFGINETVAEQDEVFYDTPCLKTLTLDAGVTLTDVRCAGAANGLQEIVGTSRSGTGSLEANATLETEIPWMTTLRSGEVMRLRVDVGGSLATNENSFIFQMPAIQMTGVSSGDEDGILTRSVDFSLNGGVIDNPGATADGNISSTTGDNELLLMYIVNSVAD